MPGSPCVDLITSDDVMDHCDVTQFDDENPPSDAQVAEAASSASLVAWALSGRIYDACQVVGERPGRLNRKNRCVVNTCGCAPAPTAFLGNSPVVSVDDVRIAGTSLASTDYRLVASNRLVRTDGERWPACQLLDEADDAENVLVVDYTWGYVVDQMGVRAISRFACELLKAMLDIRCRLPERVTSVTRQGVSFVMIDPMEFLENGRTGVYDFDTWLMAVNPRGLRRRPRVRTPDVSRPVGGVTSGAT